MKFLVVFACALAAVSAGYIAPVAPFYPGPQHLPIINQEGVPVDTPAVQQATAAHLHQKVTVAARNGDLAVAPIVAHHGITYPTAVAHPAVIAHPAHHAYPTTAVAPVSVNGVPLETPEVAGAKVAHFAAHAEALARYRRGVYAPVAAAAYPYAAYPYTTYPYGFAHHY